MTSFIGIDIAGDRALIGRLTRVPDAVANSGVEFANKYLIEIMRQYAPNMPPITRDGTPSGRKPYRRTQRLRKGWKVLGTGKNQIVVNGVPYGKYVMMSGMQARVMALRGWTTEKQRIENSRANIVRKFNAGAGKALKGLGLK